MVDDLTRMTNPNAEAVAAEVAWLGEVINARLTHFFAAGTEQFEIANPPRPTNGTALSELFAQTGLDVEARLVLALALAPHVSPAVLDPFHVKNSAIDRPFSEFGGLNRPSGAFVPTLDTALFLVAGTDTAARIRLMPMFEPDQPLRAHVGLSLGTSDEALVLDLPNYEVAALCTGVRPRPDFSADFPARRLTTQLTWSDLVLPRHALDQLEHLLAWVSARQTILLDWGLVRHVGRGYRALFYGPPGTGKTLTATLLGQRTGLDVYRVDLSQVVSKYIGETEKNLARIFDLAAQRDWILFFDEADALFGNRTSTSNANDRHANQEVSYLLQRIEECESIVILATNLRSNMDDAFFRRFQSAVAFSKPNRDERVRLWKNVLHTVPLGSDIDVSALATKYELSGASIANVVRHAAITARRRNADALSAADIDTAITADMRKEGRTS